MEHVALLPVDATLPGAVLLGQCPLTARRSPVCLPVLQVIEELSKGIVNKLLHGPMTALRCDGADPSAVSGEGGSLLQALPCARHVRFTASAAACLPAVCPEKAAM